MSFVEGSINIVCEQCTAINKLSAEDTDFDIVSGSERQMGEENQYSWQTVFNCEECDNEIEVEYEVWEYPAGVFNNEDINVKGGKTEDQFDFNFIVEPEDDNID